MRKTALLLSAILALGLPACTRAPYTERPQLILIDEKDEAEIGEAAFAQVKEESKISAAPKANSLLERVGRRIAAAAEKPDYKWEFVVIDDPSINAFALPGGKVAFYEGILPVCRDESGMAAVMGHEVAHALARHGAERISQSQVFSLGKIALLAGLSGKDPAAREAVMQAYGIGAQVGVLLPYSRKQESEADEIGLILMAKAGYDPREAVAFWQRMSEASKGGKPPELLSTHPDDAKRIERINAHMGEAMKYYEEAIAKHPEWKAPSEPVAIK